MKRYRNSLKTMKIHIKTQVRENQENFCKDGNAGCLDWVGGYTD